MNLEKKSCIAFQNFLKYLCYVIKKKMVVVFSKWSRDASELLDPSYQGVFNGNFQLGDDTAPVKDSIYLFVSQADISQHVQSALQQMMRPLMDVTTSQLSDFIAGNIYGGPPAPVPEGME